MRIIFIAVLAVWLIPAHANEILVIGVNDDSTVVTTKVKNEQYVKTMVKIKSALDEQILSNSNFQSTRGQWTLDKISLGLGLSGSIGLGPFNLGKSFKQRFFYTR